VIDGSRNLIGVEWSISKRVQKHMGQCRGPFLHSVGTSPLRRPGSICRTFTWALPSTVSYEARALGHFRSIGSTEMIGSERARVIHSYDLFSRFITDAERRRRPE